MSVLNDLGDVHVKIPTNGGDQLERFGEIWKEQIDRLKEKFGKAVEEVKSPEKDATDVPVLFINKNAMRDVLSFMREESGFEYDFLSDYSATDEFPAKKRFEIVIQIFSTKRFNRMRLKSRLKDKEKFPTLIPVWPGANWAEREIYDMFGIEFEGHPDLRRILMDVRWKGHPLRKDYPLKGYQIFPTPEPINPELLK